jgi:hypothetical protein
MITDMVGHAHAPLLRQQPCDHVDDHGDDDSSEEL